MSSELDLVDQEIESMTRVLSQTADDDPSMRNLLLSLAQSHDKRFELRHKVDDIHKVIEYRTIVLTLTPDDDLGLPNLLDQLGIAHGERFQRLGDMDDVGKAIEYMSLALESMPEDDPKLPRQLANLAVFHKDQFMRLGEQRDIEKAIECESRALVMTPNDHPQFPNRLEKLGTSYMCRFQRFGEPSDLESAIDHQSRAMTLTPDGHPHLSSRLANLATSYSYRFKRLGELSDLEEAIKHRARALALAPDDHPHLSILLANLAVSHGHRFTLLGELSDLEHAIKHETRALALTSGDHPHLSSRLANLAVYHKNRFARLGEPDDLEQAIKHETRALALTPDDHLLLSRRIVNLAVSHKDRFECLGELSDLEQSIKHGTRALELAPADHPDLSSFLANLAVSYKIRFGHLGELRDLEQTIEYESRALAAINHDHPHSSLFHCNHALSYVHYYNHSHQLSHLHQSLSLFRTACTEVSGAPRHRFEYAHSWASHASEHDVLRPIEAYQATIDLLPQFVWLGATADQRYQDLKTVQNLAVDAAHAAIISSDGSLALEWLEHARCVVWSQSLMLRSPLDDLHASHPTLATRLQTIAKQLHATSATSRESQAVSLCITSEQVGQDHRRLAKEYEDLLAKARIQSGFEDFLKPLPANRLMRAARNGPIVVINCHPARCDALVVLPGQVDIMHIPLPNFNGHKAKAACLELQMSVASLRHPEHGVERRPMPAEGQDSDFQNMLAGLWYDIVKPILDRLGYASDGATDSLPHITWCPTSTMTFLPLHAAGDYDQPRSRVFDYAVSSYTPTLTALLDSTPYSLTRGSRVLAVAQAATRGHAPLSGTTLELDYMKAHVQDGIEYNQLIDNQATVTAVLNEMERHDWVHLACHAHQNVDDPKKSGFFLSDGVLDLDEINRRSLKGKGLAFLSACQTATGDKALPDEAVHLASGMLMAGYSSVIASMWSVVDSDAPLVADKVYSQLMTKGTLGNGEAGRALHGAVGELRATVGEKEFGRWVPFIHLGS